MLTCSCGDFYVGKTYQPFARLRYEHLRDINLGNPEKTLGRHVVLKQGHKNIKIRFQALDHIHVHPRGGNLDQMLLRAEAKWNFNLGATKALGLNEYINFNPFI